MTMFENVDDIETLKRIGALIGYGNSCDILCKAWDEMLQQKYGAPPYHGDNWAKQKRHAVQAQEALQKRIDSLRSALVGLIGADSPEELRRMEAEMRLMEAPDADKAVAINAIHALLATSPV